MVEVFSAEPKQIRAGDSVAWQVAYSDYLPSDGWSLTYSIITTVTNHDFTATTVNDNYKITLATADTTAINPEVARMVGYAVKGADRITVYNDNLCVLRNWADITPGTDTRSNAKKALDAVEAAFVTMGSKAWTQSYTIGDKAISFRNFEEFMAFYNRLRAIVAREQVSDDLKAGKRPKNRILTIF